MRVPKSGKPRRGRTALFEPPFPPAGAAARRRRGFADLFELSQAEQLGGWRIYVTNVPVQLLSLAQAVLYYRDQWQLEHGFHRFKRGQLPA